MRILYAEDEPDLNRIVTAHFTEAGYSVDTCLNGAEAVDCLDAAEYDVVVLDIMMPEMDGYEVLQYMRRKNILTPVLFLTARDAISDRVKGLDLGANDYLVKPFSFDELLARIRVLTRTLAGAADSTLSVSDLTMDLAAHTVKRGDRVIDLSAKEYALLEYLMHNAGVVLSREKIEDHIWNFDYEGGTNVVDVYISYLRKKIEQKGERRLIHTVRGSGYVLRDDAG